MLQRADQVDGAGMRTIKMLHYFIKTQKHATFSKKMLHEILKIKKITTSKPHQGYLTPDF